MKAHSKTLKEETDMEKAKKLPSPVPRTKVTVPLSLLPAYFELHGLAPDLFIEPDTLTVKRER